MALTQINSGDDILASNVDQFRELLTGTMTDQAVTLKSTLAIGGNQATNANLVGLVGVASQTGDFLRVTPSGAASPHVQVVAAASGADAKLQVAKEMLLAQISTPSAPASGYTAFYTKTDGKLYARPNGGSESELLGTGSPTFTTPQINDTSSDHQYIFAVSELAADRTITLPLLTGNDEFLFQNHGVGSVSMTADLFLATQVFS